MEEKEKEYLERIKESLSDFSLRDLTLLNLFVAGKINDLVWKKEKEQ